MKEEMPMQEGCNPESLVKVAIFLEGIYMGKGNISPLGRVDLENLWKAVREIRDIRKGKK